MDKSIVEIKNDNISALREKINKSTLQMLEEPFLIENSTFEQDYSDFPIFSLVYLNETIKITKEIVSKLGFKNEHFQVLFQMLRDANHVKRQKLVLNIILNLELNSDQFLKLFSILNNQMEIQNFDKICEKNFEKFFVPGELVFSVSVILIQI
jgi:hypothetical protein